MAHSTSTSTIRIAERNAGDATLALRGDHTAYSYTFAADPVRWIDPERYPAGNDSSWDYSQGNPPNPVHAGQNISIRPNNSTQTFLRFRGVNYIGVSHPSMALLMTYAQSHVVQYLNIGWRNTLGKLNGNMWRYPVGVEGQM